jgi:hypothetical protein
MDRAELAKVIERLDEVMFSSSPGWTGWRAAPATC